MTTLQVLSSQAVVCCAVILHCVMFQEIVFLFK